MSSKLILFIDDEEDIQTLVSFCFDLEAGWQLITASSGIEGIAIAEVKQPDAILLDVMMPELDGLQTLAKLQHNPQTQHIPVIFITAKVQSSDRLAFYNAGAQGVITKPFDALTLTSQITGFLGWENIMKGKS